VYTYSSIPFPKVHSPVHNTAIDKAPATCYTATLKYKLKPKPKEPIMIITRKILSSEMSLYTTAFIVCLYYSFFYFFANGIMTSFEVLRITMGLIAFCLAIIALVGAVLFIRYEHKVSRRGDKVILQLPVFSTLFAAILAFAFLPHIYRWFGILQNRGVDYYLIGVFIAFVVYCAYATVLFCEQPDKATATST
jgi:hypothetical protein